MKIALIGATGFVGAAVLNELLQRGHQVSAIVTRPERLPAHANLAAYGVDATNAPVLAEHVTGHDAVISAFNPGWDKADIRQRFIDGSRAIVEGVRRAGVQRLIVVGGAGSLEIAPGVQLVDTAEFPAEWKEGALGARAALEDLRTVTDLEWSFVSPPVFLEPGERTGRYRLGGDQVLFGENGPARISVADLAVAIVDEAEQARHVRRRFTVAEQGALGFDGMSCGLDGMC